MFSQFSLPQPLQAAISQLGFTTPTPIQEQAIPLALDGHDILGSAATGTGKTAAFGIPLIAKLLENQEQGALIVTPTRELATQVMSALKGLLGPKSPIKAALMIGGEPIHRQLRQLSGKTRLFVGTPGRINDHLRRGSLKLDHVRFLVLDETDRMLDMGFSVQIEDILQHMPEERQTLLFSATLPKEIVRLSSSYLSNPKRVAVDQVSAHAKNIQHDVLHMSHHEKFDHLRQQLQDRSGAIIVFVKTKYGAEKMAKQLRQDKIDAQAIHGDLRHNKREQVIKGFRGLKYQVLVATDVASRGLDIPHVAHVINYDLPQCPEDYIHRIGRTARAGASGEALCFLTPGDKKQWFHIDRLMNPDAKEKSEPREPGKKKPFRSGPKKPFHRGKGPGVKTGEKKRSFNKGKPGQQGKKFFKKKAR